MSNSTIKQLITKAKQAITLKREAAANPDQEVKVQEDDYSLYSDRFLSIQNRLTNPVDIKDQLKDQTLQDIGNHCSLSLMFFIMS